MLARIPIARDVSFCKPTTKLKNQPDWNLKSVQNPNMQARKLADYLATKLASWLDSWLATEFANYLNYLANLS